MKIVAPAKSDVGNKEKLVVEIVNLLARPEYKDVPLLVLSALELEMHAVDEIDARSTGVCSIVLNNLTTK